MRQNKRNIYTIKQRISFLLVLFFCLLTSGLEYLPQVQDSKTHKNELSHNDTDASGDESYFSVSVDAVVPFAVAVTQHVLHVIYEFIFVEKSTVTALIRNIAQNFHFREILLEQIISTNAP